MELILSIAVACFIQENAATTYKFPVGTKWIYIARVSGQQKELRSEAVVTEAGADGTTVENRHFDGAKELDKPLIQTWAVKDGLLMLDIVPTYKLGSKKGDTWTYRVVGTEFTGTHGGLEDIQVPAGLYKEAIHVHHAAADVDIHLWFASNVGLIKSESQVGQKGTLVIELKQFIPADGGKGPSGSGESHPSKPEIHRRVPKPYDKTFDPWERQAVGTWYRFKTTTADKEQFQDVGLKSRESAVNTLLMERSGEEPRDSSKETLSKPVMARIVAEETLQIQGRSYLCEVRSPIGENGVVASDDREWVVKEGKNAGVMLKAESPKRSLLAKKTWNQTIRVKGREFDCLVVEAESKEGERSMEVKTWFCGDLPFPVRIDSEGMSSLLVDFGSAWAKRPAFPAAPPPEKK